MMSRDSFDESHDKTSWDSAAHARLDVSGYKLVIAALNRLTV